MVSRSAGGIQPKATIHTDQRERHTQTRERDTYLSIYPVLDHRVDSFNLLDGKPFRKRDAAQGYTLHPHT